MSCCTSEDELQPELDLAGIKRLLRQAEGRVAQVSNWRIEVRVVEQVEEFRPELDAEAFAHRDLLEEREVGARKPGSAERGPAQVPVGPGSSLVEVAFESGQRSVLELTVSEVHVVAETRRDRPITPDSDLAEVGVSP